MGLSAPPPTWATVLGKPTTVSGFGITDMSAQSVANATNATNATNANNATNVSNITLAQVLSASSGITNNVVGSYAIAILYGSIPHNGTIAGTELSSQGRQAYTGYSGTWRNVGGSVDSAAVSLFIRIA